MSSYSHTRSTDLRASFVFGYTDDVTSTSVEEALLFGLEGQDFITVQNRNPVTSCKHTTLCLLLHLNFKMHIRKIVRILALCNGFCENNATCSTDERSIPQCACVNGTVGETCGTRIINLLEIRFIGSIMCC